MNGKDNGAEILLLSLGPRIDALEVAIHKVAAGEKEAASTLRQLAQSLFAAAQRTGAEELRRAAETVLLSPPVAVLPAATALVQALRQEASRHRPAPSCVLIIGGDPEYNRQVAEELRRQGREVVLAPTATQAQTVLRSRPVIFILVHLLLPDGDGRMIVCRLRENPLTASVPLLVVAPQLPEGGCLRELLEAEAWIEMPVSPRDLVARIQAQLRRSHETIREANRDSLTGLLNRAAFRVHGERALKSSAEAGEPFTLAVLALDDAATLAHRYGTTALETVLQHAATVVSSCLRATDGLGRWDTHAVAAFFPGEETRGGIVAVEKVLRKLRKEEFLTEAGTRIPATFSAGVTGLSEHPTWDALASQAERYLFEAQARGGGGIVAGPATSRARTHRVLLLMKDDATTRVLSHLFQREGFELVHHADFGAGLATAAGPQRFHLILLADEIGQAGGGLEALRELRRMPRNNRVPIVMLISRNSPLDIVRALEWGATDYAILPISPVLFMAHMRRLIQRGTRPDQPGELVHTLVVHDDVPTLVMVGSALHEYGGFEVTLAKGLADALNRLAETGVDVLVVSADVRPAGAEATLGKLIDGTRQKKPIIIAMGTPDRTLAPHIAGTIALPLNPLTLGSEVERVLGFAYPLNRAARAVDRLNAEIQRVVGLR